MKAALKVVLAVLLAQGVYATSWAAVCSSIATGTWTAGATWSGTCPAGGPTASDDVTINSGHNVTLNIASAAARKLTISAGAAAATLTHAGNSLSVGLGGVTINGSATNNNTAGWVIGAGSATVGPVTTQPAVQLNEGGGNSRIASISLTTGSLTIDGDLTMNNANANARTAITLSNACNVFVSGSFNLSSTFATLTPGTLSTFTYNSAGTATVASGAAITYANLVIDKSGGTATAASTGTLTARNLTVQAGTFNMAATANVSVTVNAVVSSGALLDVATTGTFTVTGTTTATGELRLSAASGTKTFTGNVLVSATTGKWNNTGNVPVAMSGDLTNDNTTAGSFVSGTGDYTHTTAAQVFAGAGGLVFDGNLIINGTRTNNTTLEVKGDLSGTSTLTNAASKTLKIGGDGFAISGLTATAAGNFVEYNGTAAQVTKNTTYHHLTISNTTGPVTLNGDTGIQGNLINNGNFVATTGNRKVTFNGASAQTISGNAAGGTPTNGTKFYDLTISNTGGLTLSGAHDVEVTHTLDVTNDVVTTDANVLYVSRNAVAAIARSNVSNGGFVEGNLKWAVPTGTPVTRTFPVGTGATYSPLALTFASITVADDLTVSAVASEHPDIANSAIDALQDVNRYWVLKKGGTLAFTSYTATFTYASGSPLDLDSGTVPGSFVIGKAESCSVSLTGCTWTAPTVSGTPNATTAVASGITTLLAGNGTSFAIGNSRPTSFLIEAVGGGSIPGQVQGTPFNIQVTARLGVSTLTTFNGTVDISSSCTLSAGSGMTASFTSGVLASHAVTISSAGTCTITATRTGGSVSGTSNSFNVTALVARFDACETTAPACNVASADFDRLFTKLAGTAFTLDLVALTSGGALSTTFGGTVAIDLVANTSVVSIGSDNCPTAASVATVPLGSVAFSGGRVTAVSVGATAFSAVSPNYKAYRDVRVKFTCNAANCPPSGITYCSVDNFSVRPHSFTVTSSDATQTGTTGTPAIKTGVSFNLTASAVDGAAAAVAGYNAAPGINNGLVTGTPVAGTIGGSFSAAPIATGVATGSTFVYNEVGNFGLAANAVTDTSFTSVDQTTDCTDDFSNTAVGGKYGCKVGSTAVVQNTGVSGFGRFIPDHFAFTAAGSLTQACGAFSYMGQNMSLSGIKIEARNASDIKTQNYAGSYAKLDPTVFGSFGFAVHNATLTGRLAGTSSGSWSAGELTLGVSALSIARDAGGPDGPYETAKIGIAPVDSDNVALQSGDFNVDLDGTVGNEHAQVGAANTKWRFGRLFLPNIYGTEKLDLTIPFETQYWDSAAKIWRRNADDSCTSIANSALALGNYSGLTAVTLPQANATVSAPISLGAGLIRIARPSGGATGLVDLAVKLGSGTAVPSVCGSWTTTNPNPAGAGLAHLQGTCGASYDKDPLSHATFGVTRSKFIFNRESY